MYTYLMWDDVCMLNVWYDGIQGDTMKYKVLVIVLFASPPVTANPIHES